MLCANISADAVKENQHFCRCDEARERVDARCYTISLLLPTNKLRDIERFELQQKTKKKKNEKNCFTIFRTRGLRFVRDKRSPSVCIDTDRIDTIVERRAFYFAQYTSQ